MASKLREAFRAQIINGTQCKNGVRFQVALNGFHSTKGGKKEMLHLLLQIQLVSQEALQCQAMPQCKNEIADCYLPGKHFTALLAACRYLTLSEKCIARAVPFVFLLVA